jgi:hypothetical protein
MSIVMTMPFHLRRKFLKKWFFSSNIVKNPQVLKRWSIKKEEREKLLKKERKKRGRKRKRKAPRVSSNKRKSIFWEEKNTLTSKISFLMWFYFLPLHHTISKTLSEIIEKVFLALFLTIL